jgi:hypothetical protein
VEKQFFYFPSDLKSAHNSEYLDIQIDQKTWLFEDTFCTFLTRKYEIRHTKAEI